MNVYESAFERRLSKRLAEVIESRRSVMETGTAIPDFASYREAVGYLRALKHASEIIQEITQDLNREEKMDASNGDEA